MYPFLEEEDIRAALAEADADIAAGSVVTRNVPANTIVAGNPASERGPRWKD
jgi:acetyltransferase-like isoleucine patch superfamily enzyme